MVFGRAAWLPRWGVDCGSESGVLDVLDFLKARISPGEALFFGAIKNLFSAAVLSCATLCV